MNDKFKDAYKKFSDDDTDKLAILLSKVKRKYGTELEQVQKRIHKKMMNGESAAGIAEVKRFFPNAYTDEQFQDSMFQVGDKVIYAYYPDYIFQITEDTEDMFGKPVYTIVSYTGSPSRSARGVQERELRRA